MLKWTVLFLALGWFIPSYAQIANGTYANGTFDSRDLDTIDVGSLNVSLQIPIFAKRGRGLPFNYSLAYNGTVWSPKSNAWTPALNFGWLPNSLNATGYATYLQVNVQCDLPLPQHGTYTVYSNWVYYDPYGRGHSFDGYTEYDPKKCDEGVSSFTSSADDGSGYTLTVTAPATPRQATITTPQHITFVVPTSGNAGAGSSTVTDGNGNQISLSSTGVYTDTLGTTVMTVAGSGTPTSPVTMTYPVPNPTTDGNTTGTASYIMKYSDFTVRTNFECSGITEYGPQTAPLVTEIDRPDGSKYLFTYEPTPAFSGAVTGRLAGVTLPTGGVIAYSYSGANNGVNCNDGSTVALTRTMPNDPANSTIAYTRTPNDPGGTSHTDKSDSGNLTQYDFVEARSGRLRYFYETSRTAYTGINGSPLATAKTCYNGFSYPCGQTTLTLPISQMDTYSTHDGSLLSGSTTLFNSNGLRTEQDTYDYGSMTDRGALLLKDTWVHPSSGNMSETTETATYDGGGNLLSKTTYDYDVMGASPTSGLPQHAVISSSPGNLNDTVRFITPTTSISFAQLLYNDAGQVVTLQGDRPTTTLGYDSATGGFLTSSTVHLNTSLQTGVTYDTASGVILTSTDLNGHVTNYSYDSMLRLTRSQTDYGQVLLTTYVSPLTTITSYLHMLGGSPIDTTTTTDAYGRTSATTSPSGANFLEVDTSYGSDGRVASVTNPYPVGGTPSGATSYRYDAVGKSREVIAPDGSKSDVIYSGAVWRVIDAQNKEKDLTFDGAGRLMQVAEPDDTGALSYLTTYKYFANYSSSNYTYQTIIQQKGGSTASSDWRTRTLTYDLVGRLIAESTPEAGNVAYSYVNANGSCSVDGSMVCSRTDARGAKTSYTYDGLKRLTGKFYSGLTTATPAITYTYDQASANGLAVANGLGRRTSMTDGTGSTAWSYDSTGQIAGIKKVIGSVTKQATSTYFIDSTPNQLTDFNGTTLQYAYDASGSATGISIPGAANLISDAATAYSSSGASTSWLQGASSSFAGIHTTVGLTPMLQPSLLKVQTPAATVLQKMYSFGVSGYNNGTVSSITDQLDSTRSQFFTYDRLNRLHSAQQGTSSWGNTYDYDGWGNLRRKGPLGTLGSAEPMVQAVNALNQVTTSNGVTLVYDAAGDVTSDNNGNSWTYDEEGRATMVNSIVYSYDGDDQRVVSGSGPNQKFYWSLGSTLASLETNSFGSVLNENFFFGGQLVARADLNGTLHYVVADHLGSERMSISSSGAVEDDVEYYPWGSQASGVASSGNPYKFGGMLDDGADSGTDHATYRQYSSVMGRWLRPDPYAGSYDFSNPQSFNRYAYVNNHPTSSSDPNGLCGGLVAGISSSPATGGGNALFGKAIENGWDISFPYAGGSKLGGVGGVLAQGFGSTNATAVAGAMMRDVFNQTKATSGGSLIGMWSGGAAAAQRAGLSPSNADVAQLYLSPGGATVPDSSQNPFSLAFSGSGFKDTQVNATDNGNAAYPGTPGAGHDAAKMMDGHTKEIGDLVSRANVLPCPAIKVFLPQNYRLPTAFSVPVFGTLVAPLFTCIETKGSTQGESSGWVCTVYGFKPL